ncbi:MAG: DNA methyltransferase [Verrucomicrobia bacterium]|nr:DNA methyltransferase [Verrucomicrobiota bacterium]
MPTLNWIGKEAVVRHHAEVPFRLLEEVPGLSCPPAEGETENLIVQGDNLESLKALLPRYAGQVKCIYIDPPYNTGNEGWVYNDAVNSPEIRQWLGKTVGKEAEDLSRHDKWLCMMYPRLVLLRQFLREDGVIFVSIDENEHRYAELLLDEVFGALNRICTLIWKKSYGGGSKSKHIVNLHEYVLCFALNKERIGNLELPPDESVLRYYKFKDSKHEDRGPFRLQPLATNSMDERPNLRFPIPFQGEEIWPEKQWQWSKERALAALADDCLVIAKKKGKWSINYKQYLRDQDGEERASKMYSIIDGIYTQRGTNEVAAIFGDGKSFAFPKPPDLVAKFIEISTNPGDLILDSFAGSGTTAHAVLKMNAVEAASRRLEAKTQDASSTVNYFDPSESVAHLSGNLPHWRQDGATYFVTFRTADSMPQTKLKQWLDERKTWMEEHPEPHTAAERLEYTKLFPQRFQEWLDAGYGACQLARSDVKAVVENALSHFNGSRYRLGEYVVMPNHVHVLVSPLGDHELSDILQAWKSFTAKEINRLIGETGHFWQKESFDHIVRSPDQMERIKAYIRDNPNAVEAASRRFGAKTRDASSTGPSCGLEEKTRDASSTARRFILCEIDEKIAADITAERVRRVARGYKTAKGEEVAGLGGGFQFAKLGKPLFDESGQIRGDVKFAELAEFVFFRETGRPLPKATRGKRTPLLGSHDGRAVYLLFNGILGDRSVDGGNVLTGPVLAELPPHAGPKVIYAAACRMGRARLDKEQITFKQTPYDLQVP